jgi:hypothetical protein
MKKIAKIIPIVIILTISILFLIFINFKEANEYLKFKNYKRETMSIKYDSNNDSLLDNIRNIQSIARKNNVILLKVNVDNKNNNNTNLYLSLENITELKTLLSKNFDINLIDNKMDENSFFSTFDHHDNSQVGIIKDLFGDNLYTYYLMDRMFENNDCLFGNYYILYTDFQDYSNFMNDVKNLIGYDVYSMSLSTNIEEFIAVLLIGSLIFLLIFYFIFQIFDYNNNAKKIGCMKLLGFENKKINKNMIYKNMLIYIITTIIVLLLSVIFVKNITLYHMILLLFINFSIILLTYSVSYLCCKIINKSYKITNILKMQSVSTKISSVSYKLKIVMTILLVCFSAFAFNNASDLYNKLKAYNSSKNLLEYGLFQSYVADQPEIYDYDKQHELYLKIINNMDTVYAQFHDYSQFTQEDFLRTKNAESEGKFYVYDSVDKNYLKKEKIKIYDLNNNEVDVDSIDKVFFLFPKSKKNYIEAFHEFNKDLDDYYLQFNEEYEFSAYLYDDQFLDTYQVDYKSIESPILRVIDNSIKYPSFYDGNGLSFFGERMITGLKTKLIDGDKEKTIETLESYINDSGLTNLLNRQSFITFKDYFNDEIIASQIILLFTVLMIVLILIVYILISFQLLKLYIESQKKKVLVKKLLGFDNNYIFECVYTKNLNNTLIAIVISFIILIIIKQFNISFIILVLLFLILDFLITLLSIKTTKLSTIYLDLKGGYHD